MGVASDDHVIGHVIPMLPDAEGANPWSASSSKQQCPRAGSGSQVSRESRVDHTVVGESKSMQGKGPSQCDRRRGIPASEPGCVGSTSEHLLKPKAAAKTFSYAQALKTSLTDSAWSSSRSHTPSEGSLLLDDTRTPTPVPMLIPVRTPTQTPPLGSNTLGSSPDRIQISELPSTPDRTHQTITPDSSPDPPLTGTTQPEPKASVERMQALQSPSAQLVASMLDSPSSDCSPQGDVMVRQPGPGEPEVVNEEGGESEGEKIQNPLVPSEHFVPKDVVVCDGQHAPPGPLTHHHPVSQVQASLNSALTNIAHVDVPKTTPASLPAVGFPRPPMRPDQGLGPDPVPSDHPQPQLSQKQQWPHPYPAASAASQQLHNQQLLKQRLQGGPQPLQLQNQQNTQGNIHVQQHNPQHVPHLQLQQAMQLKQQQQQHAQQLHVFRLQQQQQQQQIAEKQQLQQHLQHQRLLQHAHRLQQQRQHFPEPASLVSVARLPTPRQPLHPLTSRPLMTVPAPQVLPTGSHLPPRNMLVLQAHLLQQHQHVPQKSRHLTLQQNSELQKSNRPTSPPGLWKARTQYAMHSVAGKQSAFRAENSGQAPSPSRMSPSSYPSGELPSTATGGGGPGVAVSGDKRDGNGDLKTRLSVTASPFVPGGKSEQPVTPTQPLKKISPPLVEGAPLSTHLRHPPGFKHPQVPRPFLLQPAVLPAQALPLTAVRPLTTIPATPLVSHPPLPLSLPPAQLAALRMQPSLPKTVSLPLHLPAHTTRQTSVQTRPVPFYQYHQHSRGDALLRHDPTHLTKVTPSPSETPSAQTHSLLDQPKVLQVPPVVPPGSGGLIPNPYAVGVAFVPPVAMSTLPLTTPTPSPSPQTLSFVKSSSALQAKKALLPTPTTIPAPPGMVLPPSSTTAVPLRLPLAHGQEQQSY